MGSFSLDLLSVLQSNKQFFTFGSIKLFTFINVIGTKSHVAAMKKQHGVNVEIQFLKIEKSIKKATKRDLQKMSRRLARLHAKVLIELMKADGKVLYPKFNASSLQQPEVSASRESRRKQMRLASAKA